MTWQTLSTGSDETEWLGELLGRHLKPPALVELRSDLGGGKTTFVKGLARGAGSKDTVTSPTFTLNQIYHAKDGVQIAHHDFYRLKEAGIMANELAESLQDDKTITVVEWSGIVEDVLPHDRITIEFKSVTANTDERQIIFSHPGSQAGLFKRMETEWTKIEP
ncbi:tRNA (adenosine(37)-N6)-threonylcarbamoyltransferase complex ATPase subunit type 1 TsaE [Candidatus Saccharibacteria bacterium]|nr:tRNA (adenosine(37)-N6)-threonylcarbamoyltransferase complex ATPase subunit type 1 TsaE [Candidatus Saccharibacteria bacterium]